MANTESTMSRGLGKMQRLILASLKPAKQAYVEGKFNYSALPVLQTSHT